MLCTCNIEFRLYVMHIHQQIDIQKKQYKEILYTQKLPMVIDQYGHEPVISRQLVIEMLGSQATEDPAGDSAVAAVGHQMLTAAMFVYIS